MDNNESKLDSARRKINSMVFEWKNNPKDVVVQDITGPEWQQFGDSDVGRIKLVTLVPESYNIDIILYEGKKGSDFPMHKHSKQIEYGLVFGKVEMVTPDDFGKKKHTVYKTGELFLMPKEEPHEALFLEDTLLILVYSPSGNGVWAGEK